MEKFNATTADHRMGGNATFVIPQNSSNTVGQCAMSFIQGTILVVINSLLVPLGTFGNILVIVAILKTPQLRKRISNFLLLSLAVADLLVTLCAQPLYLLDVSFHTFAHRCTSQLELGYKFVGSISCSSSVLHLAAISMDRALSIVKPHQHQEVMKKWGLKLALGSCWGASVLAVILYLNISSMGLLAFTPIYLCYFIIICSYGVIFYHVKCKNTDSLSITLSTARERDVQKRVSATIGIIILLFTLCWSPFLVYLIKAKRSTVDLNYSWIRTLYLSNSSMNFIVYSLRIRYFRRAYLKIINRIMRKVPDWTASGMTTSNNYLDRSMNCSNLATFALRSINHLADSTEGLHPSQEVPNTTSNNSEQDQGINAPRCELT